MLAIYYRGKISIKVVQLKETHSTIYHTVWWIDIEKGLILEGGSENSVDILPEETCGTESSVKNTGTEI